MDTRYADQRVVDPAERVRRDAGLRFDARLDPEELAESMAQGGRRVGVVDLIAEESRAAGADPLSEGVDQEIVRRAPQRRLEEACRQAPPRSWIE